MIRGTTPKLEFTLPFDVDSLAEVFITLAQNGTTIVEKALKECECNGRCLSVMLTQDDTLKLDCDCNTEIQIRAKSVTGEALASNIFTCDTGRILKDGVI
jgi:hypothetical protein